MIKALSVEENSQALEDLNKVSDQPWEIVEGMLSQEFTFKNFLIAFDFMKAVAVLAHQADHHPQWSNMYNKVKIQLVTHEVNGISLRDFSLATAISKL